MDCYFHVFYLQLKGELKAVGLGKGWGLKNPGLEGFQFFGEGSVPYYMPCGHRYTFLFQFPFHFSHEDIWKFDIKMCNRMLLFIGSFTSELYEQKPKSAIYKS